MPSIEWARKAAKQLRKLDRPKQVQVRDAVDTLKHFPECRNVKYLHNHKYSYRLRVGRYRVFFRARKHCPGHPYRRGAKTR